MNARIMAVVALWVFTMTALCVRAESDEDKLLSLEWIAICHKGAEGWNKPGWGRPDWQCLYKECEIMWEVALSGNFQTKTGSAYKESVTRKSYVTYTWSYTTSHKNVFFNDTGSYKVWSLEYVTRKLITFPLPVYRYPATVEEVQVSAKATRNGRVVLTDRPLKSSCIFVFKPVMEEA